MRNMRKGREFYSKNYEKVMDLHKSGVSTRDIADRLGLSYSCIYHWVKGLRKPDTGNISDFENFLVKNGPTAVIDIKDSFPKHNELFLTASRRGLLVKRYALSRKFGEYSTWYFMAGQENELNSRLEELFSKYNYIRQKLTKIVGD